MEQRRRIAAYGLCRADADRVLLVRASAESSTPGLWLLPGGGIEHGEHPATAVVREIAEETGLAVAVVAVRDVVADVARLRDGTTVLHQDRVIYEVAAQGGTLRDEFVGSTDAARWVPMAELPTIALFPFTAELFGLPVEPRPAARYPVIPRVAPGADRGQRFAAYGLATDPAGRVLLTRIAPLYPGAGRWHLPGGGTDFGEQPAAALLRELAEETDQVGRIVGLLDVTHRRVPRAVGPEGRPIDWHTVRALYRVRVDAPTEPRVTEANGSTAAAAWFGRAEARRLMLTEVAAHVLLATNGD